MQDILTAVREQHDELAGFLAPLDGEDWQRPSPCDGWSVADVVLHLCQTDDMAIASLDGRYVEHLASMTGAGPARDVDDGADRLVAAERGQPGEAVRERWATGASRLRAALADADAHARVQWVAGELSVQTLATTRLAECWIHTGDVADGLGLAREPAPRIRHIARLAWRTLPYAFTRAGQSLSGPVAFELRGPGGEEWDYRPDEEATTVVRGDALDLCLVAGRRREPAQTGLTAEGPDADAVLALVRTYA
jgi:uncharacterized protein (TIGR03084 family)